MHIYIYIYIYILACYPLWVLLINNNTILLSNNEIIPDEKFPDYGI